MLERLRYWWKWRNSPDYDFQANPDMDALCDRFDDLQREMWFAMTHAAGHYMNHGQVNNGAQEKLDELASQQKAIQKEGGEEFKLYLAPYFSIAKQWQGGRWGKGNPPTTPKGWKRFRTANNWRE